MKKALVVALLAVIAACGTVQAEDNWACGMQEVDITLDATYVTEYIWRGYAIYGNKAAFQPSINMDFGNGFSANVFYSVAGASGYVDGEEFDYSLTYANSFCTAEAHQVDWDITWIYYDYPDAPSKGNDVQELNVDVAMPNLLPTGWTPRYQYAYVWSAQGEAMAPLGNSGRSNDGHGFFHTVGLQYDWTTCGFLPCNPEQTFNFTWDMVYNDGAFDADNDWSHTTFGLSTPIVVGQGTFTPAVYYQITMDDSVNSDKNELWAGFSYTMNF